MSAADPVRSRLASLAAEYDLPTAAPGRLGVLLERLAADDRAPTPIRDAGRAVDVHVADSLAGLRVPEVRAAGRIADLGAGAGLPSLVLAAALPDTEVFAVESVGKKAEFIVRTAQAMGLANLEVVPLRVEEWRAGEGTVDVVTARALAALVVLVEYAAPLLREGGHLVAWKGPADAQEERDGATAAEQVGLAPLRIHAVTPFPGADRHHLHLYSKVAPTPDRYPRRPGMARKRPLAGSGRA